MMNYKGYIGKVEFDDEQHIFTGEVINTRAVITFQGSSVKELEEEFENSVDDYIEWCNSDGVEPEKPYSGKFNVRIYPQLHQRAAVGARLLGISLNSFLIKSLEDELELMHI
ncbi:MAG: type II toxin-antitoxin system HicB family antitoxin [Pseudobutyrivibrio sp.]|nr:type II toxin-antitoxin system HicB family antitoxin [Pseudobutyrivibrio sp.]